MASLVVTGCKKPGNDEKDPDENGNGTIIRHDSWDNLMSYNYDNVTVLNEDSMLEEASYIFSIAKGQYIDYYPIFGEWYHQFFADYNGSNYVYWDNTAEGGTTGWLNYNSEYHVDLTLEHQDFYLPNLLNGIHEEDVEYSAMMNSFYVKDEALARISEEVFGFAYDHSTFATIAILVETDENNHDRIQKVRCFDRNTEDSPFVQLSFGYYGTTRSQWGFPPLPSETTVKDYWTITGKTPKVEKYPSSINITANNINDVNPVVSDSNFDLVMEVGDYADVSYLVNPADVNMSYIVEWTPDRSDFIDNSGNPTSQYDEQVALIDIKQNFTSGHKYLTAMKPGTVNVYATAAFFEYDENDNSHMRRINSNVLKVKVNEPQVIDDANAVFKFNFVSYEDIYNDQVQGSYSGLFETRFNTVNIAAKPNFKPVSRITGFHTSLLEPGYTDAYEDSLSSYVLRMNPQGSVNDELVAYVDFDLDDQDVSKIAFSFSLHRQNQLTSGFKTNYKSFKIYTSSNGVDWNEVSDQTEYVKTELNKDEGLSGMKAHNLSLEFAEPTRFIRLACEAKSFTGNFSLIIDEVTLSNDTITHVEKANVAVNGVSIVAEDEDVRINNSIIVSCAFNPSEATNKVVYWTSSHPNIASVKRNADGTVTVTGHREGNATIKVYTNEKDNNGNAYYDELEITVLGAPTMPSEITDGSYSNVAEQIYFTFSGSTLSAIVIREGVAVNDTLALADERNGKFVFTSANSLVEINSIAADGSNFEVISGYIKDVELSHITLNRVGE